MSSTQALPPATSQEQLPRRGEDADANAGPRPAGEERQPFVLNVRGFLEVVGVTGPSLTISSVSPQGKYAGQPRVTPPPRKSIASTTAAAVKAPAAAKTPAAVKAPAVAGSVSRTAAVGAKSSLTATTKTPATRTTGSTVVAVPKTAPPSTGEGESKENETTVRLEQTGPKATDDKSTETKVNVGTVRVRAAPETTKKQEPTSAEQQEGTAVRIVAGQPPEEKVTATTENAATATTLIEKAATPKAQPKLVKKAVPTLLAKAALAKAGEKTEGESTEGETGALPKALKLIKKAAPAKLQTAAKVNAEEGKEKKDMQVELKDKEPKEATDVTQKKDDEAAKEAATVPTAEEGKTVDARLPEGVRKSALGKKVAPAAVKVATAAPKSEHGNEEGGKPRPKAAPVLPAVKVVGKATAAPAEKAKATERQPARKEAAEVPKTGESKKLDGAAEQIDAESAVKKEEKETKAVSKKRSIPGGAVATKKEISASKIAAAAKAAKVALGKAEEKAIPSAKTETTASAKDVSETHAAIVTEGKTAEVEGSPTVVAVAAAIEAERKEGEATVARKVGQKRKLGAKNPAAKKVAPAAEAKVGEGKATKPAAAPKRVAAKKAAVVGTTATAPSVKKTKPPGAKKEKLDEWKITAKAAGTPEKKVKLKKKGGGSSTSTSGSEGSKATKKIARARVEDKEAAQKPSKTAAPKRKVLRKKGETAKAGATTTKKAVPNLKRKVSLKKPNGSPAEEPKAERRPEAVDAISEKGAAAGEKMETVKHRAEGQEREEKRQQKQEGLLKLQKQQEKQEAALTKQEQPDVEKSLLQKGQGRRLERQLTEEKAQRKQQEETVLQQQREIALQPSEEERLKQQWEKLPPQDEAKSRQQWEQISDQQQLKPKEDVPAEQERAKEAEASLADNLVGAELHRKQTEEASQRDAFLIRTPAEKLAESVEEPENTKEEDEKKIDGKPTEEQEGTQLPDKKKGYNKFPFPAWCSTPSHVPSYKLRSKPWPSRDVLVQRMSPSAQKLMEEHTAMMLHRANVWLPPRKRETASADLFSFANCLNSSKALHYLGICCCCQSCESCQPHLLPERGTTLRDSLLGGGRPPAAAALPPRERADHVQPHSAEVHLALEKRYLSEQQRNPEQQKNPKQQQTPELQRRKFDELHRQQASAAAMEPLPQRSLESKQTSLGMGSSAPQGSTGEDRRHLFTPEQQRSGVESFSFATDSAQNAADAHSQAYRNGQQTLPSYYDEKGNWIQGFYDDTGTWVQHYYDETGRLVQGYCDETGNWVRGYYDDTGNWIRLPAMQHAQ